MKTIISPQYEYLRPYLADITTHFENGREIHAGRNHIRVITPDGQLQLNVKRYAIPRWPNRLIYSCLRKPKGLRAFIYPQRLIDAGIPTPPPVAYIEQRTAGLIGYSYFVSLQSELPGRLYELGNARMDCPEHISLARDLARFAARIHEARLTHLDFSPGNVLYETLPDGSHRFALVDINRMRFGEVDMKRGCANFARLWGQPQLFELLAQEYAAARGFDPKECYRLMMDARRRFWSRFVRRHKVKYDLILD